MVKYTAASLAPGYVFFSLPFVCCLFVGWLVYFLVCFWVCLSVCLLVCFLGWLFRCFVLQNISVKK